MSKVFVSFAVTVFALFSLAACGGGGSSPGTPPTQSPSGVIVFGLLGSTQIVTSASSPYAVQMSAPEDGGPFTDV